MPEPIYFPQLGLFAFGNPAHAYLEFDRTDASDAEDLVRATVAAADGLAAGRALNVVIGFRPELWRDVAPEETPPDLRGFDDPVTGPDGFTMPGTQRDVFVWIAAGAYDVIFDATSELISRLEGCGTLVSDVQGWHYHENKDLTGFVDGTENPTPTEAPDLVLIKSGEAAGGCVLLLQQWFHQPSWLRLPVAQQEAAIGRTKDTNEELHNRPDTSHVARTDQDEFGHIMRRNTAFGSPQRHGTMFVGFSAKQQILASMLDSMTGIGAPRDALTRYSTPTTGSYYYIPSLTSLRRRLLPTD